MRLVSINMKKSAWDTLPHTQFDWACHHEVGDEACRGAAAVHGEEGDGADRDVEGVGGRDPPRDQ